MANQPVIKKRNGAYSVAIFAENKQRADGSEYVSYGAVLQKSIKDVQTGEWKTQQINMFENNVLEVAALLQNAANALIDMKNPEPGASHAAQPAAAASAPANQPAQPDLSGVADDCPF